MTIIKNCKIHGDYEAKVTEVQGFKITQDCQACTREFKELEKLKELQLQKNMREMAVRKMIEKTELPKKYSNLQGYKPMNEMQNIEFNFDKNLMILGGFGSGKTMFISHLGLKALGQKKSVRYLKADDIREKSIQAMNFKNSFTQDEFLKELINVDVLILDEIGRTEYNKYLFKVLDGRYENEKITILAGNVQPQNIKSIFGDAIVSRLQENLLFANFGNIDLRAKGIF